LFEVKKRSTSDNAHDTARHFLHRISNSAMPIRRQQLSKLKQHCATKNDPTHKNDVPGKSQKEQDSESCKRCEMLKTDE
jgi:hypothetical protein